MKSQRQLIGNELLKYFRYLEEARIISRRLLADMKKGWKPTEEQEKELIKQGKSHIFQTSQLEEKIKKMHRLTQN